MKITDKKITEIAKEIKAKEIKGYYTNCFFNTRTGFYWVEVDTDEGYLYKFHDNDVTCFYSQKIESNSDKSPLAGIKRYVRCKAILANVLEGSAFEEASLDVIVKNLSKAGYKASRGNGQLFLTVENAYPVDMDKLEKYFPLEITFWDEFENGVTVILAGDYRKHKMILEDEALQALYLEAAVSV
ncbi:hypothetical protein D770_05415 [Flammeovirgaceae bacterium 311]|nr:hypothetical protein D770_05415 [Flammeovirgaceae bacterium 311]